MLSTRTTHSLKPLALAVAALAVPMAQAEPSSAGKYGPLDPWAYNLVQRSLQPVPIITEHSAGQNGSGQASAAGKYGPLDPRAYNLIHKSAQSVPLITEHSAGQNGSGQASAAGKYGSLDPAIAAAIRTHPAGQNGVSRSAAASVPAAAPNGFHWGAAGVGASVAFASILLALGVATFIVRRSRARLAGL